LNPVPDSLYARRASCFPGDMYDSEVCKNIIRDLFDCGVESLVSWGGVILPWGRLLGKGHASIVTLGIRDGLLVVVKVRRTDSKHSSFRDEAVRQKLAWKAGVAPRVHCFNDNVIVMDIVQGKPLGFYKVIPREVASKVLWSAYTLDAAGIWHKELSRPWRHVYVTRGNALIIDYGSASFGCCGNLPSIAGALMNRLGVKVDEGLRRFLAEYKKTGNRRLYTIIHDYILGRIL
jgi:predicted Ser/Thr protein kinase